MLFMFVTLEVSKLSGWLNANARCRVERRACAMRVEVWAGRRRTTAAQAAARGGAHVEHVVHARDAGCVEAQWLVERRRALPRVERRAYRAGRGAAREAADDRGASSVQEGLDCRLRVGHGEERTPNMMCMSVTLEVSKLSGWLNADAPCRESKGGHTVRGEIGGRARGGAHEKHVVHARDAGGVEAQRLVERRRALPRVERRAYRAGRGAAREAADDRAASSVQEGLDCRLGAGHGEERTQNMPYMFVTPEVSQLEMSALKFCEL
eukprot:scaffold26294_cov60-Phaeocystis_antarctica.AAC.2